MRKFDPISTIFWLVVGILICEESIRINLGTFSNPGPGFLPFGAGLVLGGLALVVMIQASRKEAREREPFWTEQNRWPKIVVTVVSIFVYGLLLETLGFFLTTILIMGFLFRVIEPQRWRTVILGAFLSATGAHLIFQVWLKAELPRGFLGI